jgi:hypothetical protein
MTLKDAVGLIVAYVAEWDFDDNPSEHNVCGSCGWDSRKGPWPRPHGQGLSHHPGCKLRAALDVVNAFLDEAPPPVGTAEDK